MADYKSLLVFKKAFSNAMDIFYMSKNFSLERYSLTGQIRSSSRSVCANIAEAYRKRQYPAHFISKISDSDKENAETQTWLLFAFQCSYITSEFFEKTMSRCEEVGKLVNHMIYHPEKYLLKPIKEI